MHASGEPLESGGVLDELADAAGVVLWQSLRDVTLWAGTPPRERDALFSEAAERNRIAAILTADLDPELEQPLGMITAVVGRPGRVSAERVALACRRISQWAEKHGHLATALAFAQAAALTCPGDASAAFKVGQIARRRAEYTRAETWFRRAIALARQERDWTSYALGFAGLGTLYMQKGNFPKARAFHTRRLRAAKRHGLRDIAGGAFHDLCLVACDAGDFAEAQALARAAFDTYGARSPRIPRLAHDVAYLWTLQGQFARALPVLTALLPHTISSAERLIATSNIARASGATGDQRLFDRCWSQAWASAQDPALEEQSAEAFLELAKGALSLRDWNRAEEAGSKAFEIAQRRREARVLLAAEGILEAVQSERMATSAETREVFAPEYDEQADSLVEDFLLSLENNYATAS